ncbi:histone-lysine N-methyltransferase SETDB1-like isoform X4 [Dreissena polymorpha]|uniref:histone-lysine N-methyltransferase SETDB1-like isoform X4 n=1 Tax=Dreissena polymorpha TaxID=45954 RepID=UPI002263CC98|nr:histone-lysine N-methyltransferase SETDB1-like isoform X4 [Dreissena polymorpha]
MHVQRTYIDMFSDSRFRIRMMDADTSAMEVSDRVFQFSSDIDLGGLVDSVIADLCGSETVDDEELIGAKKHLKNQIKLAERKQRDINRIFSDCMEQLVQFKNTLEDEVRKEEDKEVELKAAVEAAANGPAEITIVDSDEDVVTDNYKVDDDDDVQFIQKTFDPTVAQKRQAAVMDSSNSGVSTTQSQTRANLAAALSSASNSVRIPSRGSQPATQTALNALQQKKPAMSYMQSSQSNQEHMEKLFLFDVNAIKVGDIILGRRYGDVWQKAELLAIIQDTVMLSQHKYKVRFLNKKMIKVLTSRQVAFKDFINKPVLVGTRITAVYKDEQSDDIFYAGIIAEAPNGRNDLRYLVFFDDGYAQYCSAKDIHKVFYQSRDVWEDIHPDSQDFVKDYLAQYPERPMVRLHKGQTVKTEWKGKWWVAKVEEVDASLVLMYFPADKRGEWIYRGSTRLEPLYSALANAEANRNAGKMKRHNLNLAGAKKPVVEYTRNNSTENSPAKIEKRKAVAKKSTTPQSSTHTGQMLEPPWMRQKLEDKKPSLKIQSPDKFATSTISGSAGGKGKDMATVLQDRLGSTEDSSAVDLESLGTRLDHIIPSADKTRKKMVKHRCDRKCLGDMADIPEKFKGNNPLLIPLFFGWERHVAKTKPYGRRVVFYRAPCGRRLRNLLELDGYLEATDSQLAIDHFCCDPELHVHYEFIPVKTFCDIKDISYGKENVVISCVNGVDRHYPDYVDYSNQRIPATGVKLNLDPNFLVCCNCEDNCRDRSKCACQQLTVESSAVTNGGKPIPDSGYRHRRLEEPLSSGVYECNSRCKCDKRCGNRVAQNGLQNRLQVFKTEKRGWGLRCLDDIPHGGFICIYAGQLLTDQGANEDGQQYGDEYLAELDYIEVAERQKEGYESDVENIEDIADHEADFDSEGSAHKSDSDESFKAVSFQNKKSNEALPEKRHLTRLAEKSVKKKQTAQKSSSSSPASAIRSPDLPDLHDTGPTDLEKKKRVGRSTAARYGSLNPSKKDHKEVSDEKDEDDSFHGPSVRDFFKDGQSCYIMDAKSMGNIGRYLNHSCLPNAFVQNVFVDTHDLRFPWIAFFAGQYISAGSELTWDYNYEVGSVPGKVLYCYCGSADCRGRLL